MKVALFGAGAVGKEIYNRKNEILVKYGVDIVCFGDNDKNKVDHKLVFSLEEIKQKYEDGEIEAIYIAVLERKSYYNDIRRQLKETNIPIISSFAHQLYTSMWYDDSFKHMEYEGINIFVGENIPFYIEKERLRAWVYDSFGRVYLESDNYKQLLEDDIPIRLERDKLHLAKRLKKVCILAKYYTTNYWHFIYEALDKLWMLEKCCNYDGYYVIHHTKFAEDIIKLLDIDLSRIIWFDELQNKFYIAEELWAVESFVSSSNDKSARVLSECANYIIDKVCDKNTEEKQIKKVFVKRIGRRKLIIPDSFWMERGFEIFIPEEHSLTEQIACFHNADIVVTPHGANSSNVMFMRKGAYFVELFPVNWLAPCCLGIINERDIRYRMLVGRCVEKGEGAKDFDVDERLIDLTLKDIAEDN